VALDWGSGGEWSAVVSDIERSATKVEAEAADDDEDVPPIEVSENADSLPQQSTVAASGLFDDLEHATADLKQPFDSVAPKEVSDDDYEPLIVFEDQQDVGEEEEIHGGVVLDEGSSDGAASQSSDSELFDLRTTRALREHYSAAESSSEASDDEEFPVVSVLTESEQHTIKQDCLLQTAERETDLAAADASQKTGSDSDIHATSVPKQHGNTDQLEEVSDDKQHTVVSASEDAEQRISEQQTQHENEVQESGLSDAHASKTSDSDFDTNTISDLEQPGETDGLEEVSDDEQQFVVSSPKDVGQHIFEQKNLHETAMQESDLSEAGASQTSGYDSDIHIAPTPKQSDRLETFSDDEQHLAVSALKDVDPHTDMQKTGPSDADVSHTSDSDVSDMQLPASIIRGPFLNPIGKERIAENRATVSPKIVLRGLIRDAHPEMIHFTLPHSLFSPDDLRSGLQYAYSMLQAATSELTILELLADEATEMTGNDLGRWIALVDNAFPLPCSEARITVIFESLSIGEMKAALEELVHARLAVEGETEKTRLSLRSTMVAKERQEKNVVISAKRAAKFDAEGDRSSSKKRRVSEEDSETALDAFLTAIVVVLIGVLYLCICEYPVGSAGDRSMSKRF
jgi:hypothetical protein